MAAKLTEKIGYGFGDLSSSMWPTIRSMLMVTAR